MKSVEEIYQEMAETFAQETGVEVNSGGDMSVRLYAVAAEIYALYVQGEWVARQCFPQTADGEYLERHAQLRGLERRQAVRAKGMLRFMVDSAPGMELQIPVGTVCMTIGEVRFETTEDGTLEAEKLWVDIPAQAIEPGIKGNVSAGAVVTMAVPPVGVSRCGNPEPFSGGQETENDTELRSRVMNSFQRLPNGANKAYYEQEAMSFEQVAAVSVLPRKRGIGTVDVVVAETGGIPTEALLEKLQQHFEERREIAVDVVVRTPNPVEVEVSLQVAAVAGGETQEILQRVRDTVTGWFNGERLGERVLLAQLGNLIFSVDGVSNYMVISPAQDIEIDSDQLPVLKSLTVEEMA